MAQIREIELRMKAVANIRRITKTMQMIATSKFARAESKATAAKPYTDGVFDLVRELAATAGDLSHPLIQGPNAGHSKPELLLIITSDRGLCGGYNGSILRSAMHTIKASPKQPIIELVGKKGAGFLKFKGVSVTTRHTQFGDSPQLEDINRLADNYMERFIAGEFSAIRIVSTRYLSAGKQHAEVLQLLPLKPTSADTSKKSGVSYEFSPPAGELLGHLLPVAVRTTMNQLFNEAAVSEHVARMIAMKAATDNAGKMVDLLKRTFNRARQGQITTELTEIISGAAALE